MAPNIFQRFGASPIASKSAQSGAGSLQNVDYIEGRCSFDLEDGTTVTVGILADPASSKLFDSTDFAELHSATRELHPAIESVEGPLGNDAFVIQGPVDDTIVMLHDDHVFTVRTTRDGRAVAGTTAAKYAQVIVEALSDIHAGP